MEIPAGSVMRTWWATVRSEDVAEYVDYVQETGVAEYRRTQGNLGAVLVTRDLGDGTSEVRTVSFWRSRDDIAAFAGHDIDVARYYPEDDRFLLTRPETVDHFDVR
jgi:heme-degrading monooxygenase HmoA